MMQVRKALLTMTAIVAAASALIAAAPGAEPSPSPAMVAAGRAAFAPCSICHATTPGKNGLGPSLAGVIGSQTATVPGFAYSAALKAHKEVWTRERVDAFIAAPQKVVPGTRMAYPGQPDAAKRAAIVAYLATLK